MSSAHHSRTDSSASSSTCRSATPPLDSSASDDSSSSEGLAWYQIPAVRRWKERGTQAATPATHSDSEAPAHEQRRGFLSGATHRRSPSSEPDTPPQHFVFVSRLSPPHNVSRRPHKQRASPYGRRTHEPSTDEDEEGGTKKGPWACPVRGCLKELAGRDPKTWLRHLDSHWSHVYKRYSCPKCKAEFSRPESVLRHAGTKRTCLEVGSDGIIMRQSCWMAPAYVRFLNRIPPAHPLYKTLEPVLKKASGDEPIEHPPWPVLQPQLK